MRAIVDVSTGEITLDERFVPQPYVLTNYDVNAERDRRIFEGTTFTITGYAKPIRVTGDAATRENLSDVKDIAEELIAQGVTAPYMVWRDSDNFVHLLTPKQMKELWFKGAMFVSSVIEAAWPLKDDPSGIPSDYADDSRWPA